MSLDPTSTDFSRHDTARIKINTRWSKVSFYPITITDRVRKYKVAIYPVVLREDIKMGVDESKWVDFGVISEEGNVNQSNLRIEDVVMGSEDIMNVEPVRSKSAKANSEGMGGGDKAQ